MLPQLLPGLRVRQAILDLRGRPELIQRLPGPQGQLARLAMLLQFPVLQDQLGLRVMPQPFRGQQVQQDQLVMLLLCPVLRGRLVQRVMRLRFRVRQGLQDRQEMLLLCRVRQAPPALVAPQALLGRREIHQTCFSIGQILPQRLAIRAMAIFYGIMLSKPAPRASTSAI